jgi:hypothetical protein
MSQISDEPKPGPSILRSSPKASANWVEVDLRRGKIKTVGDPAIKTLLAIVAVVISYLFFAAISIWGVAKLWLL